MCYLQWNYVKTEWTLTLFILHSHYWHPTPTPFTVRTTTANWTWKHWRRRATKQPNHPPLKHRRHHAWYMKRLRTQSINGFDATRRLLVCLRMCGWAASVRLTPIQNTTHYRTQTNKYTHTHIHITEKTRCRPTDKHYTYTQSSDTLNWAWRRSSRHRTTTDAAATDTRTQCASYAPSTAVNRTTQTRGILVVKPQTNKHTLTRTYSTR